MIWAYTDTPRGKRGKAFCLVKPERGTRDQETWPSFCQLSYLTLARPSHTNTGLRQQRLIGRSWCVGVVVSHLLKGVVPEYTDRLASLLSLQQGKLHQDRPRQRARELGPLTVHQSTHHWGVDDGPVGQSAAQRKVHRSKHGQFTFVRT